MKPAEVQYLFWSSLNAFLSDIREVLGITRLQRDERFRTYVGRQVLSVLVTMLNVSGFASIFVGLIARVKGSTFGKDLSKLRAIGRRSICVRVCMSLFEVGIDLTALKSFDPIWQRRPRNEFGSLFSSSESGLHEAYNGGQEATFFKVLLLAYKGGR